MCGYSRRHSCGRNRRWYDRCWYDRGGRHRHGCGRRCRTCGGLCLWRGRRGGWLEGQRTRAFAPFHHLAGSIDAFGAGCQGIVAAFAMLHAEHAAGFIKQRAISCFITRIDRDKVATEITFGIDHDTLIVRAALRHDLLNGDFFGLIAFLRAGARIDNRGDNNHHRNKQRCHKKIFTVHSISTVLYQL